MNLFIATVQILFLFFRNKLKRQWHILVPSSGLCLKGRDRPSMTEIVNNLMSVWVQVIGG